MEYNNENRELKISTGYVKRLEDNKCYKTSVMVLGIYDKPENYVEISKEDFENWEIEEEERILKEQLEILKKSI